MDAYPVCAVFRWPGSVFGARYPALGIDPVPGTGSQVPGARYPIGPDAKDPAQCPGSAWDPGPGQGFPLDTRVL